MVTLRKQLIYRRGKEEIWRLTSLGDDLLRYEHDGQTEMIDRRAAVEIKLAAYRAEDPHAGDPERELNLLEKMVGE
jgi:hypothetical protein